MTRGYLPQTPKLSKRLQMVAQMVPECGRLVDIGTDHAFIPIYLIATGRCDSAIATDIKSGPADIARRNIDDYCMEDRITVLVQDGIGDISIAGDDCLVISGMGGLEIQSILSKKVPADAGTIILQPQKSLKELRLFLSENGYPISEEKIIKEKGHFYIAIKTAYTGNPYKLSAFELECGHNLSNGDPDSDILIYNDYMNHLVTKLKKQIIGDASLAGVLDEMETRCKDET
ncbi:MAG: tRNA (adenine(22)-N(1))-methyltransferase [Saccharofermentanales bacterium]